MSENTEESENEETEESDNEETEEYPAQYNITLHRDYTNRTVTDKNWRFLFILIFVIWVGSWSYAIYDQSRSDFKINNGNVIATKSDNNNITAMKNETEFTQYHLWGNNWIFDAITFNLTFLNLHYENSGIIVIVANALLSIVLLVYSIISMRIDYGYQARLNKACFYIIFLTICLRMLSFTANYFEYESVINFLILPKHEKLCFWLTPEVLFIGIWYTKKCYTPIDMKERLNRKDEVRNYNYIIIPFILVALAVLIPLCLYSMDVAYKLGWSCPLTYLIVGGSCYIGLTIFYYLLMAFCFGVYNAVYDDVNEDGTSSTYQDYRMFYRALFVIFWYHFGSTCYHATVMVPRLHAIFAMNNSEIKEMPRFQKIWNRFYATHCKMHNLTLMSTVVVGSNHPESLIGLLRHLATNVAPKFQYFRIFNEIIISLAGLFMSSNCLMLIVHWIYGIDDPHLSLATWSFYLRLIIIFSVPMKFYEMASDTMLLMRGETFDRYTLNDLVLYNNLEYTNHQKSQNEYELNSVSIKNEDLNESENEDSNDYESEDKTEDGNDNNDEGENGNRNFGDYIDGIIFMDDDESQDGCEGKSQR